MNYNFTEHDKKMMLHCPKGSVHWALGKMKAGETVAGSRGFISYRHGDDELFEGGRSDDSLSDDGLRKYSEEGFIKDCERFGPFRVYKRAPYFKKGDWLRNMENNRYYQMVRVTDAYDNSRIRMAGSRDLFWVAHREAKTMLIKSSLTPDFAGAKVGDKIFNILRGYTEIDYIDKDDAGNLTFYIAAYSTGCKNDGRQVGDKHPIFFIDHYQAEAYFRELFMKLDKEEEKKNEL